MHINPANTSPKPPLPSRNSGSAVSQNEFLLPPIRVMEDDVLELAGGKPVLPTSSRVQLLRIKGSEKRSETKGSAPWWKFWRRRTASPTVLLQKAPAPSPSVPVIAPEPKPVSAPVFRTISESPLVPPATAPASVVSSIPKHSPKPSPEPSRSPAPPTPRPSAPVVMPSLPPRKAPRVVAPARSITLPTAARERPSRNWSWIVLGAFLGGLIGVLAITLWTRFPQASGTIADAIPSDTLAFMSVRHGASALENMLLPTFTEHFGITPDMLGSEWSEAAYVLMPGASPAEPVPLLLLTGKQGRPNVAAPPQVVVEPLSSTAVALVQEDAAGRVAGFSKQPLGQTSEFRRLELRLKDDAEQEKDGFLYMREGVAAQFLRPFLMPSVHLSEDAFLFTLASSPDAGDAGLSLALRGVRSVQQETAQVPQPATMDVLWRHVPAAALSAHSGQTFGPDLNAWRVQQSGNPTLQEFLRRISSQGAVVEALGAMSRGPFVAGTLATASAGVRDGFLLVQLLPEKSSEAVSAMRQLDEAFRELDVFLTGGAVPTDAFEDTTYRDVAIRYLNFGSPQRAVDYAVQDDVLMLATSREAMYSIIDAARDDGALSLAKHAEFQASAVAIGGHSWSYFRVDPAILTELSAPWQTWLRAVRTVSLAPVGTDGLVGLGVP